MAIFQVMKMLFLSFLIIQGSCVLGQSTFYNVLPFGRYEVGYSDTTIYDNKFTYEAFGYNGKKPYFVKIWHPITSDVNAPYLLVEDILGINPGAELKSIGEELSKNYSEIMIRDYISENVESGETNHFGDYSFDSIEALIGKIKTRSIRNTFSPGSNYPVIVYHHGSQSNPAENYAMAEYFASRGFIFISANFHLPFENTIFGLRPYAKIVQNEDEESLKTILAFAKTISTNPNVFFIGHSLGAQMGFRALDQETDLKGFISLETTLEFKNDYGQIQEYWPEVYRKIAIEKANYPFPVMLCAATGKKEPFYFLDQINAQQLIFTSTEEWFEHDAYLSLFYLRYFLEEKIPQSDKHIFEKRLPLYAKHLHQMHQFLNGIMEGIIGYEREIFFINEEK